MDFKKHLTIMLLTRSFTQTQNRDLSISALSENEDMNNNKMERLNGEIKEIGRK
jgi:hypothetical protein